MTSAKPIAFLSDVPPNMTSSIFEPRRLFEDCSPRTQRTASEMLLLPEPLGPMTAVMPFPNSSVVLSGKDLKPCSSSAFSNIYLPAFIIS